MLLRGKGEGEWAVTMTVGLAMAVDCVTKILKFILGFAFRRKQTVQVSGSQRRSVIAGHNGMS